MVLKDKVSAYLYKNSWYWRLYIDRKSDRLEFAKVYSNTPCKRMTQNVAVVMFSGKSHLWKFDVHGGLADRLKGMVSVYKACLETNYKFRIFHTMPYRLEDFLIPNQYDWRIAPDDILYNINAVSPHYLRHSNSKDESKYQFWKLKKCLTGGVNHIYSNVTMVSDEEYKTLFHILFKPTPELQQIIDDNLSKIGGIYISLSFRFCHLLGDPIDEYMPELMEECKSTLMQKMLKSIIRFHSEYQEYKILVSTDSATFIHYVNKYNLDYVYINPGTPVHIDQVNGNVSKQSYMKTFVDFFMISKAYKVFLIKSKEMRNSGTPANVRGGG